MNYSKLLALKQKSYIYFVFSNYESYLIGSNTAGFPIKENKRQLCINAKHIADSIRFFHSLPTSGTIQFRIKKDISLPNHNDSISSWLCFPVPMSNNRTVELYKQLKTAKKESKISWNGNEYSKSELRNYFFIYSARSQKSKSEQTRQRNKAKADSIMKTCKNAGILHILQ